MNRCHRHMSRIAASMRRKHASSHDGLRQCFRFLRGLEKGQAGDDRQSLLDFRGIANPRLIDNQLRYSNRSGFKKYNAKAAEIRNVERK